MVVFWPATGSWHPTHYASFQSRQWTKSPYSALDTHPLCVWYQRPNHFPGPPTPPPAHHSALRFGVSSMKYSRQNITGWRQGLHWSALPTYLQSCRYISDNGRSVGAYPPATAKRGKTDANGHVAINMMHFRYIEQTKKQKLWCILHIYIDKCIIMSI